MSRRRRFRSPFLARSRQDPTRRRFRRGGTSRSRRSCRALRASVGACCDSTRGLRTTRGARMRSSRRFTSGSGFSRSRFSAGDERTLCSGNVTLRGSASKSSSINVVPERWQPITRMTALRPFRGNGCLRRYARFWARCRSRRARRRMRVGRLSGMGRDRRLAAAAAAHVEDSSQAVEIR